MPSKKKFISDEQMAKKKSFISDEEMEKRQSNAPSFSQKLARGAVESLPVAGGLLGGVVGSAAGPVGTGAGGVLGYAGGRELERLGKQYLLGDEIAPETIPQAAQRVGTNVLEGAAAEVLGPVAGKVSQGAGGLLRKAAEKAAVAATGATGKQAMEFAPNAGRELLDLGLVKALDTPASIAKRVAAEEGKAAKGISGALQKADSAGITIDPAEVIGAVNASKLALTEGQAGKAAAGREMNRYIEDLAESLGKSPVKLSELEKQKRSFSDVNWADPEKALGKKSVYRSLRGLTEEKLGAAAPELAEEFSKNKRLYGLLDPIQEAAEKRASQLNQHPPLGFLDMLALTGGVGGGLVADDPTTAGVLGVAAPIARRIISPRVNPSKAVLLDALSKSISPKLISEGVKRSPGLLNR